MTTPIQPPSRPPSRPPSSPPSSPGAAPAWPAGPGMDQHLASALRHAPEVPVPAAVRLQVLRQAQQALETATATPAPAGAIGVAWRHRLRRGWLAIGQVGTFPKWGAATAAVLASWVLWVGRDQVAQDLPLPPEPAFSTPPAASSASQAGEPSIARASAPPAALPPAPLAAAAHSPTADPAPQLAAPRPKRSEQRQVKAEAPLSAPPVMQDRAADPRLDSVQERAAKHAVERATERTTDHTTDHTTDRTTSRTPNRATERAREAPAALPSSASVLEPAEAEVASAPPPRAMAGGQAPARAAARTPAAAPAGISAPDPWPTRAWTHAPDIRWTTAQGQTGALPLNWLSLVVQASRSQWAPGPGASDRAQRWRLHAATVSSADAMLAATPAATRAATPVATPAATPAASPATPSAAAFASLAWDPASGHLHLCLPPSACRRAELDATGWLALSAALGIQ